MTEPILGRSSSDCGTCGTDIKAVSFIYPGDLFILGWCAKCDVMTMRHLLPDPEGAST